MLLMKGMYLVWAGAIAALSTYALPAPLAALKGSQGLLAITTAFLLTLLQESFGLIAPQSKGG